MPVENAPLPELPDLAQIRILRKQLGWTQRKLAQATGLSQSFINKIERNEADPGYRTARNIFQVLNKARNNKSTETKTALDLMTGHVDHVSSNQIVAEAKKLMLKKDYSQLPVIDNGRVKGSITDRLLISLDAADKDKKIAEVMDKKFPVVDADTKIETLRYLLNEYPAVLVDKGDKEYGIITKHDLIRSAK